MANNPQKAKDATAEALSAIQEALNVRESDLPTAAPHVEPPYVEAPKVEAPIADAPRAETPRFEAARIETPRPEAPRMERPPVAPVSNADLFHQEPEPTGWADEEPPRRRAANDDRATVGQLLHALQKKPSSTPFAVATAVSAIWALGALAFAYLFRADLLQLIGVPSVGPAAIFGLAAAIVIPVIFAYVIALLIGRSQDLRHVAESLAEVAVRLTQPEGTARESIVSVGQAIRREVAAMGDGVERALARAAELEALVHNEVSALERAYNDNEIRIRDLLSELSTQRETLVGQAEHVRNAISSVHLDLSHDIASVGDLVADKVNEVAQRVTRTLTEKGEHITLALGHAGDSMIDALSERGSELLLRLETSSDRTTSAISSASDRLSASLTFKTDHVHDEFAQFAERLQHMMTTRLDDVAQGFAQKSTATIEQMSARSRELTDSIIDTSGRMSENIAARVDEVNTALRATGDSLVLDLSLRGGDVVSKMEQTGARITDTIVSRSSNIADTFSDSAETLVTALNSRGDAVKDMLTARLQAFEDMFNHGGTELTEKIARDSSTLGNLIVRHIVEFDRTVKTYGGEIVDRLGQRTRDVSEAMRNYVDTFDERVTSRTQEVSGTLDQKLIQFEQNLDTRVGGLAETLSSSGQGVLEALDKRIGEVVGTIDKRGTEVADSIGAKIGEIDATLGSRALEVANTLDNRVGRFEELLVGRAETVTNQIEARTKAAADALNARVEQLSQSIKSNSGEAERALSQLAISTTEAIRTSAGEVERTLLGVSAEVARNFVGKADEITDTVSRSTAEMTAVLSDRSGGVLGAITEKGVQFALDVQNASDTAMRSIEERGLNFARAMMESSEDIARLINKAGDGATTSVSRVLNELHATAHSAIEQSKQTSNAAVTEMLETHSMLSSDTTALFERLREANIMLQEVLSGSHENIAALENTLMLRVSDFVAAMNDVSSSTGHASEKLEESISGFREVTARVVTDLGQLAVQFESQGRDLGRVAEHVELSNQRTESAVNERRVSLDSLVATLDIRTEDIDERLKRFSGLLDESLESASARAREIARVVSESSGEGTRIISEQFERVRTAAEEERRRTVETMRTVYEQSTGDTHEIFRDASERFAEIVQGMKQMTAEMQRELEATRAELRRGILELPQETSESAAQMRRVIVDQIEALAELNRIVARHGRNLDTVEPTRRAVREEQPLAVASSRSDFTASRPAARDPASFAPPSARRLETPTLSPTQGSNGTGNNRGWLTDLLNRASREEDESGNEPAREPSRASDERTPRHSIESLDSLSVDIARMIDHEAAADLWDRYKRGERNVFTRRLYTLQGQAAFDEIRRKYRADREFKQTVDRYIVEFEHLLEEVSRDDRGQVVARTYLTSETGKVYTMLAHAAGRFD
ncbi:MAG: hypothetical protein WA792_12150 [Pseudolabrys sp.]